VLNEENIGKSGAGNSDEKCQDTGLPLWKRIFDLSIILFLLPATFLIGLAVSLLVALGSRGPILFRQRRVGYKGREFVCYKFRTMKADADTSSHKGHTTQLIRNGGAMTKLDAANDPRLIPLGAALRASGLDELPQLINVLRGEMSIVGPRPCIPYEYEVYKPWQRHRFDAVPGLTGLWQISGKNRTTFNEMIHLDIKYSKCRSLWLDLMIVFKTVPALWTQCKDLTAQKKRTKNGGENPPVNMGKPVHSNW
jgi:lipopolysaccharide/colanic/teichoic acid biosynthesis glycosyltransferase